MIESIDSLSDCLLKKIRETLRDFCGADRIRLCAPHQEQTDIIAGVCLYDIQDYSANRPVTYVRSKEEREEKTVSIPSKLIELGYMIYINQNAAFGESDARDEHRLLTEIIRSVYEFPFADDNKEISLSFSYLNTDSKIKLWQAFSKPLQPAVYIIAGPLAVYPRGKEIIPTVRQRKISTGYKPQNLT